MKDNIKKIIIYSILLIVIIIIGIFIIYKEENNDNIQMVETNNIQENEQITNQEVIENIEQENKIVVHIIGQVINPGIVKLKEGARIIDQTTPIMIQRLSHLFVQKPLISIEI